MQHEADVVAQGANCLERGCNRVRFGGERGRFLPRGSDGIPYSSVNTEANKQGFGDEAFGVSGFLIVLGWHGVIPSLFWG